MKPRDGILLPPFSREKLEGKRGGSEGRKEPEDGVEEA
jgi:hypothetical protein